MLRMQHLRRRVYDEYVPAILKESNVQIRLYLKFQKQLEAYAKIMLLSQLESVLEKLEKDEVVIGDLVYVLTGERVNPWGPIPEDFIPSSSSECR